MKKHFLIIGLCILATNNLLAQNRVPYSAVPFLKISPDAYSAGMGDVGAATTPNANAIFHNVSKLAFVKKKRGITLNYTPWLRDIMPDMSLVNISGYTKYDDNQAFGLGMTFFNLGNIDFTNQTGANIGRFLSRELNVTGGYSRKLSRNFAMGLNMRYIYSNLSGNTAPNGSTTKPGHAIATDITAYYHNAAKTNDGENIEWAFGAAITNIGTKISYGEPASTLPRNLQIPNYLPANLKMGANFGYYLDDKNKITVAVDADKALTPTPPITEIIAGKRVIKLGQDPNRGLFNSIFTSFTDAPDGFGEELQEWVVSAGAEYAYNNTFAVRAGYHYENAQKGGRQYFTAGLGAKVQEKYNIDFSYLVPFSSGNPLANTFRISMMFDINEKLNEDKITE